MVKPPENLPQAVADNWEWARTHEADALKFLKDYIWRTWLRESTEAEDMKRATDYVVTAPGNLNVAVRIRRVENTGARRDLTLRASLPSGAATEIDKVRKGEGDIYLYCWTASDRLREYIIIDMHRFRACGLLNMPDGNKSNRDGSATFAYWHVSTLEAAGVLLDRTKQEHYALPDPTTPVCKHTLNHTDPKGTWAERRDKYGAFIACECCGKFYGYIRR